MTTIDTIDSLPADGMQVSAESRPILRPPVEPLPPARTYEHLGLVGIYDTEATHWQYWHLCLHLPRVTGQFFSNSALPFDGYWYHRNYFDRGVSFIDSGRGSVAFTDNFWEQPIDRRNREIPTECRTECYVFNTVLPYYDERPFLTL